MRVAEAAPKPLNKVNYNEVADNYNQLKVGETALEMDRVSNITLFKRAVENRGLVSNVDFKAFNNGEHTFVLRLTQALMKKD